MGVAIFPPVAEILFCERMQLSFRQLRIYYSAPECSGNGPARRGDTILRKNAAIFPPVEEILFCERMQRYFRAQRRYYSAKFCSDLSASCGDTILRKNAAIFPPVADTLFCPRATVMSPRAAECICYLDIICGFIILDKDRIKFIFI
jgi:hypothetical protein